MPVENLVAPFFDEQTALANYRAFAQLVKDMVAKESAAMDARTAKLRALRLAKEAEDSANAVKPSKPAKKPKTR